MKLLLAAPASFLPSEPTALAVQLSIMHFFMKLVLAAPASGLPSLPMAFVSQESSANAEPAAKVARTATRKSFFMAWSPWGQNNTGLELGIVTRSSYGPEQTFRYANVFPAIPIFMRLLTGTLTLWLLRQNRKRPASAAG